MKKFSKLILLILALVTLVAAFTVVSFATEKATVDPYTFGLKNYDNSNLGQEVMIANYGRYGRLYIDMTADGNKYLVLESKSAENGQSAVDFREYGVISDFTYNLMDYPYYVMDFDIMTPTGEYYYPSLDIWFKSSDGTTVNSSTSTGFYVSSLSPKLDMTPYSWQHATVILVFNAEESKFAFSYYLDGEYVASSASKTVGAITAENASDVLPYRIWLNMNKNATDTTAPIARTAIDNYQFSFYPVSYSSADAVAADVYRNHNNLPDGEKIAASLTHGDDVSYYADVNEAIAAAVNGDTVNLFDDVEKLILDKAITIDTRKYFDDRTTSAFDWQPSEEKYDCKIEFKGNYAINANGGVYSATETEDAITVVFDPACEGDCDCYLGLGHPNTFSMKYVAGSEIIIPENVISTANGVVAEFLGWSFIKGSAEAEEITTADAALALDGVINVYPVYANVTKYAIEVISPTGASAFENDYVTAYTNAVSGSTLKLHADLVTSASIAITKSITIDLNGYDFKKVNEIKTIYTAKLASDGVTYEKDTSVAATTEGTNTSAFTVNYGKNLTTPGCTLEMTNSNKDNKSNIYNILVKSDVLKYGEEIVDEYITSATNAARFISGNNMSNFTLKLNGNLAIYSGEFFSVSGYLNTNKNCVSIYIDGIEFYAIGSSSGILFRHGTGGIIDIRNSKFFSNGANILSDNGSTSAGVAFSTYIIENCDLLGGYLAFYSDKALIKNCRFDNYYGGTSGVNFDSETLLYTDLIYNGGNNRTGKLADNTVLITKEQTREYTTIASTAVAWDTETNQLTYDFGTATKTVTFRYAVESCSEVEGSITDAKLSMIYTTGFKMMLYIPVTDARTVPTVDGFTALKETVLINSVEHYVYEKALTTQSAGEDVRANVNYKVNSLTHRQTFTVSALVYAGIVLADENAAELEISAVGNMVRYIKEAVLYGDEAADTTAFDELITKSKIAGYATEYTDTADYSEIAEYLTSINFTITDGVASYKIVLADASYAEGLTVSAGEKTFELTVDGAVVIVDSARVYDVIDTITVTVNGAVGTYSILENIEGVAAAGDDTGLLKAIYEFGVAAKAYRENRTDY